MVRFWTNENRLALKRCEILSCRVRKCLPITGNAIFIHYFGVIVSEKHCCEVQIQLRVDYAKFWTTRLTDMPIKAMILIRDILIRYQ